MFAEPVAVQAVVLDRVTLYAESRIEGELLRNMSATSMRLEYADEIARRHILRMFGKSASIELSCPATWWDHVKLALRSRWPKLFERLRIKTTTQSASCGAVMGGLPPATKERMVIPYYVEPKARQSLTGGTLRDNEEPWRPGEESLESYVRNLANERYRDRHARIEAVVVHPSDFRAFCLESERRNDYQHTSDRQVIHTACGPVRIDIDPSQTRGVAGVP